MKHILLLISMPMLILFPVKRMILLRTIQVLKAELSIEFDNIAGSSDLQLNTGT